MSDTVLAAVVTGGFGIVIAMIGYLAHTNKRDHGENSKKLDYLADLFRDHLKGHK